MKRLIVFIFLLYFLLVTCGGGKEAIPEITTREQKLMEIPPQQEGERPSVAPESLSPVTVSKRTTRKAPYRSVGMVEKPKETPTKPPAKPQEATTADTIEVAVKVAEPTPPPAPQKPDTLISPVPEDTVAVEPEKEPPPGPEPVSPLSLPLNNLTLDDIYFDSGEWMIPNLDFNSNYFVTLGKLVKVLKGDPDIKLRIKGHTDNIGSLEYNRNLAEKRAIAIGGMLLDLFAAQKRDDIANRIEIVAVAEEEPLIEGAAKIREVLNRRVSFELFYGPITQRPLAQYDYQGRGLSAKRAAAAAPAGTQTCESGTGEATQEELYKTAHKLFNQKKYGEAVSVYREIITIDPEHSLADNAQWWIGEALYFQKRYSDALAEYRKVFDLGNGNKAAYAQLRIGYCYLRMNQTEQAIQEFLSVNQKYPRAKEETEKADRMLRKLQSK